MFASGKLLKMRKICFAALLFGAINLQAAQAQGVLGKLKEKSASGGGGKDYNGVYLPDEKDGQKDLENTKLDGTVFTKDARGISGLYVAQKPIGLTNDAYRSIEKTVQKFAIQLNTEGDAITISHTGDSKPWVYKYAHTDENLLKGLKAQGMYFHLSNFGETSYREMAFTDSIEYDGKPVKESHRLEYLTMLEPGVFVWHPAVEPKNGVTTCAGGSTIVGDEKYIKYNPFNLIYLKGKDVSKWTDAAIIKELLRQSDVNCSIKINGWSANAEMPKKVTGFKDEPTNADLLKAANGRAKEWNWVETIVSVYPIAGWENYYEEIGPQALRTLTKRFMRINVNMKTPSGECAIEEMVICQENVFTAGTLTENFKGKPVFGFSNGNLTPIDCKKMK